MKHFINLYLPKFILLISIFIIFSQIGYSQTADEFLKKDEQERQTFTEALVRSEINRRLIKNINGKPKSDKQSKLDRRYVNLIQAFFDVSNEAGQNKVVANGLKPTTIFVAQLLAKSALATMTTPTASMNKILVNLLDQKYRIYFTNADATLTNDFDDKTDGLQRNFFLLRATRVLDSEAQDFETDLTTYEAYQKSLESELDASNERLKKYSDERKEGENILNDWAATAINELEVIFRPSKSNPKIGTLAFKISQKIPIKFNLQCYNKENKSKDLSVSITANGVVSFMKGKNSFTVGETCDFYIIADYPNGEKIRTYTVSPK